MYFGVPCACFALPLLTGTGKEDEKRRIQREEAIEASYMNLDMRDNHSSAKLDASPGAKVVSNSAKTRSPLTDIVFEYDYLELKTDPEILQIVTLQK
ncbi:hypothetical protein V6N11_001660 [Hibiscus sabdariffa]|uniref:Uncharacterized protein n=1 Tax=Hibiscus sabdariffa TaxID=183260 RepID=A0ABR1ZUL0_9ROSI